MIKRMLQIVLVFCFLAGEVCAGGDEWLCYAGSVGRGSIAVDGPDEVSAGTLAWVAWEDPWWPGYEMEFKTVSAPAVYGGKVYTFATYLDEYVHYAGNQLIAFDAETGEAIWKTRLDGAFYDSWSSPAIDRRNGTVLIGSGKKVYALDAEDGSIEWVTAFNHYFVNASACVVDDLEFGRVFITDYDGQGRSGKLYCINTDPNSEGNLYEPGEVVWSEVLGGTSGNTCAYRDGVIYVASVTDANHSWAEYDYWGTVHAYSVAEDRAELLWRTTDPNFEGFFGGVTVTKEGFLYAANYDFKENLATLCKLDCQSGDIVWTTQTETTTSIPIVVGDKILICGGYKDGEQKLRCYRDDGDSVVKLWQTGESLVVGGWTHQPVYANGKLYIGTIPPGTNFNAYTNLYVLDVSLTPADEGFVISSYSGCGSSPAVTCDAIYTIGGYGDGWSALYKFSQERVVGDIDGDGGVGISDMERMAGEWLFDGGVGVKREDLDLDGVVGFGDFAIIAGEWGERP